MHEDPPQCQSCDNQSPPHTYVKPAFYVEDFSPGRSQPRLEPCCELAGVDIG